MSEIDRLADFPGGLPHSGFTRTCSRREDFQPIGNRLEVDRKGFDRAPHRVGGIHRRLGKEA
jgi:hypothetical protein